MKNSVSPLVSVVLLVAFTVSLGTVVMDFGSDYIKNVQEDSSKRSNVYLDCAQKVTLSSYGQTCYYVDGSNVTLFFKLRTGNYPLKNIRVSAISNNLVETKFLNTTLESSKPFSLRLYNFSSNLIKDDVIQSVEYTPVIARNLRDSFVCSDKTLKEEDIKPCLETSFCIPNCNNKCGGVSDGCGGTCDAVCPGPCDTIDCGPDGEGSTCGICSEGLFCDYGTCCNSSIYCSSNCCDFSSRTRFLDSDSLDLDERINDSYNLFKTFFLTDQNHKINFEIFKPWNEGFNYSLDNPSFEEYSYSGDLTGDIILGGLLENNTDYEVFLFEKTDKYYQQPCYMSGQEWNSFCVPDTNGNFHFKSYGGDKIILIYRNGTTYGVIDPRSPNTKENFTALRFNENFNNYFIDFYGVNYSNSQRNNDVDVMYEDPVSYFGSGIVSDYWNVPREVNSFGEFGAYVFERRYPSDKLIDFEYEIYSDDTKSNLLANVSNLPLKVKSYNKADYYQTYVYDQALSIIASVIKKDYNFTKKLVDGLFSMKLDDGNLPFRMTTYKRSSDETVIRSGSSFWAINSVLYALDKGVYDGNDTEKQSVLSQVKNLTDAIIRDLKVSDPLSNVFGGYFGGKDVTWVSTEHMTDAYWAFYNLRVYYPEYQTEFDEVKNLLLNDLYDESNEIFYRGGSFDSFDGAHALDVSAWLIPILINEQEFQKAKLELENIQSYYYQSSLDGIKGYQPYNASLGYPDMQDTIWLEGTMSVVMALIRLNEVYNDSIESKDYIGFAQDVFSDLITLRNSNGYPYATRSVIDYDIGSDFAVSSTIWTILGSNPSGYWNIEGSLRYE